MHAGEYGVSLVMETGFDLTSATAIALDIRNPTGSYVSRTVPLPGSGTVATYTTLDGDFPTAGTYGLMVQAQFGATKRLKSDTTNLKVGKVIA
jgi:hypothetical protein